MSSFAEKQLKKYGWTEGEGIGKSNQGIAEPIKASFKFNNNGVGYDMAEEFTSNWWEHLFNHTAKKIDHSASMKESAVVGQGTKKEEEKPDKPVEVEAGNKPNHLQKKSYFYSRFQKGSCLIDGEDKKIPDSERPAVKEDAVSYDKKGKKIVSDEDLFIMCEGRTAHKGARHGIKMNGKLARIEKMERLEQERLNKEAEDKAQSIRQQEEIFIEQPKKTKRDLKNEEVEEEQEASIPKKKKKSKKSKESDE